jgi:hypothetical protein
VRALIVVLSFAALVAGCPRTDPPADRMGGIPCNTMMDCNPDHTCGEMTLCLTGVCEAGHTLIIACPHTGMRPGP